MDKVISAAALLKISGPTSSVENYDAARCIKSPVKLVGRYIYQNGKIKIHIKWKIK